MKIITDESELRKPCTPVKLLEIPNLIKQFPEIANTMMENEGCGLASVQIGIHKTFFIAQVGNGVKLFINPEITYCSEDTNVDVEGCLSVPGVNAEIERSNHIRIKYFDYRSNKIVRDNYVGLTARILQHEYDQIT